ncbi:MAG: hypothetical protein EXQ96_07395 [Alphaproteobacteria bacterium]|nr:hypothetical protein [Alphaproteobacteria bacterium]
MVGRVIGLALLLAGIVAAGVEIVTLVGSGQYQMLSFGDLWSRLHANSLVGLQALIEKNLSETAFLDVVVPALALPLWPTLGGLGLILFLIALRPRRRKSVFGRRL